MRKEIVYCDACGKEVERGYFRSGELSFKIDEWAGGSMGGREDIFIQKGDLCEECAHKLQKFIKEMGVQPIHPKGF